MQNPRMNTLRIRPAQLEGTALIYFGKVRTSLIDRYSLVRYGCIINITIKSQRRSSCEVD